MNKHYFKRDLEENKMIETDSDIEILNDKIVKIPQSTNLDLSEDMMFNDDDASGRYDKSNDNFRSVCGRDRCTSILTDSSDKYIIDGALICSTCYIKEYENKFFPLKMKNIGLLQES